MRYFLDFDRTIFDTPAFKKTLAQRPALSQLWQQFKEAMNDPMNQWRSSSKWRAFWEAVGTFLSTGRFMFAPDEVAKFLYPEVPAFLKAHGEQCTVVTYGVRSFITAKVASALRDFTLDEIVYTDRHKGRTIRRLTNDAEGPFIFIDDAVFQCASVARKCPEVQIYEIRRDGGAGDGRWPVIHSLDELPSLETQTHTTVI